ncbi:MAG: hypothetical protein F6K40_34450 [Okeania sp. SIO3I5]|uniref:hypothetical protein n=1 Tax=Okeania sp. SIO3I5 TaxID=2607805 RepID=UPI0013BDE0B2|nr:hypothetical protein [Okeania sp. SIO3I5]NEQ41040.1 hypothetical protein [Okeania sp. SIO3I5]
MVERVWEVWEVWEVGSCGKLVRVGSVGRNYKTYVSSPFLSRTTDFFMSNQTDLILQQFSCR